MTAKISELAIPTLPLAGTELLEVSQAATSVKVTFDELTSNVLGGIGSFDGTTFTIIGDIVANDITLSGETLYLGTTIMSEVSDDLLIRPDSGIVDVGLQGAGGAEGRINLRGDDSDAGGHIRLFYGDADVGATTYYIMQPRGGELRIGPNNDTNSLKYNEAANQWNFTGPSSQLRLGSEGIAASDGRLELVGDDSVLGGSVYFYVAPAYDTTIDYFRIYPNQDELLIGPDTDPDSLFYDGPTNNSWAIRGGNFKVGIDDAIKGNIYVYGDSDSAQGQINIYNGAAYSSTVEYFRLGGQNDSNENFMIGPDTDFDSILYNQSNNSWNFTAGLLNVGADDVTRGLLNVYGPSSGKDGGTLRLYTSASYDTTIQYFQANVYQDDFFFGPDTDFDAIKYVRSDASLQFNANGDNYFVTALHQIGSGISYIGSDDNLKGLVNIYGDSNKDQGGLRIYNAANYDSTVNYYGLGDSFANANFNIGPNTDPDSLRYAVTTGKWGFTHANGTDIGVAGATRGTLYVYGNNAKDQGRLYIYNGATYDSTVDFYLLGGENSNANFNIGPDIDPDSFRYEATSAEWQFTGSAGLRVGLPGSSSNRNFYVGSEDEGQGFIHVYGAGNTTDGGAIRVYSPSGSQTQNYYELFADGGPFRIKNSSGDTYLECSSSGSVSLGNGSNPTTIAGNSVRINDGILHVGTEDFVPGIVHIDGSFSGPQGGRLLLYTSADYDDNINSYGIDVVEENLLIGPDTDPDALMHDGTTGAWVMAHNGSEVMTTDSTGIVVTGSVRADDLIVNGNTIYLGGTELTETGGGGLSVNGSPLTGGGDLKADGTVPLTADWDVGNFTVAASQFGLDDNPRMVLDDSEDDLWLRVNSTDLYPHLVVMDNDSGDGPVVRMQTGTVNQVKLSELGQFFVNVTNSMSFNINGSAVASVDSSIWNFPSTIPTVTVRSGNFTVGNPHNLQGKIYLEGGPTATTEGGLVRCYTGLDHDDNIDYYDIQAYEDDLYIGPDTDLDALKYDGGSGAWVMSHNGSEVMSTDSTGIVVVGSVRANDLIVDGDTIFLGGTTLTEAGGGGLLVNGQPIAGGVQDKIEEGNSSVEIIDTGTGSIVGTVDGGTVLSMDDDIQIIGGTRAGGSSPRITLNVDNSNSSLNATTLGSSTFQLEIRDASGGGEGTDGNITMYIDSNSVFNADTQKCSIGQTLYRWDANYSGSVLNGIANGHAVLDLTENTARIGKVAGERIELDNSANTIKATGVTVTIDGLLELLQRTGDPTSPADGESIIWMADGSGSRGADGDIVVASNEGSGAKYTIIHTYASATAW